MKPDRRVVGHQGRPKLDGIESAFTEQVIVKGDEKMETGSGAYSISMSSVSVLTTRI